jgi:hypothetical protein
MKITPDMGKDVRDSSTLGGEASSTPAQKATNETVQYSHEKGSYGPGSLGGENSNS